MSTEFPKAAFVAEFTTKKRAAIKLERELGPVEKKLKEIVERIVKDVLETVYPEEVSNFLKSRVGAHEIVLHCPSKEENMNDVIGTVILFTPVDDLNVKMIEGRSLPEGVEVKQQNPEDENLLEYRFPYR